jgi:hypothetical protein
MPAIIIAPSIAAPIIVPINEGTPFSIIALLIVF